MQNYLNLLRDVKENGIQSMDRTGTGTLSVFGRQMRFDLTKGFPIMTTKKVHWRSVVYELLWFIKGDTNVQYLHDNKVTIWDEWADEKGNLGPIYGKQWRNFGADGMVYDTVMPGCMQSHGMTEPRLVPMQVFNSHGVDQLANVIDSIKKNPYSRRHIVSAWNPIELPNMALPPCHCLFQFYVRNNKLSCQLYQRSVDVFLGLPFNIASYSLLTHIIAKICGLGVGEFVWTGGDTHIYLNHLNQVNTQLDREPFPLPTLHLSENVTWENLSCGHCKLDDFTLDNYVSHPTIKAPIAV